jgi:hypothetical protein
MFLVSVRFCFSAQQALTACIRLCFSILLNAWAGHLLLSSKNNNEIVTTKKSDL